MHKMRYFYSKFAKIVRRCCSALPPPDPLTFGGRWLYHQTSTSGGWRLRHQTPQLPPAAETPANPIHSPQPSIEKSWLRYWVWASIG